MIELSVCIGSACHLKGSYNVVTTFQHLVEEYGVSDKVELKMAFCMRRCAGTGVSVTLNGESYGVKPEEARAFFKAKVLGAIEEGNGYTE